MKILEYKYHEKKKLHEFKCIDETSEKAEKTSDQPLESFAEALENLKGIIIKACNLKDDTEVDIIGIKMDTKRETSVKLNVNVFMKKGAWKFNTQKIYIIDLQELLPP